MKTEAREKNKTGSLCRAGRLFLRDPFSRLWRACTCRALFIALFYFKGNYFFKNLKNFIFKNLQKSQYFHAAFAELTQLARLKVSADSYHELKKKGAGGNS